MSIKSRIKEIYKVSGLSQEKLALVVGVKTTKTLQRWMDENDPSLPSADHLEKLCALGFRAEWLLTGASISRGGSLFGSGLRRGNMSRFCSPEKKCNRLHFSDATVWIVC